MLALHEHDSAVHCTPASRRLQVRARRMRRWRQAAPAKARTVKASPTTLTQVLLRRSGRMRRRKRLRRSCKR
jgi:hypothetical protein